KAKYIVQSFVQIIDFIKNKKKKNIHDFKSDKRLVWFDEIFELEKDKNLLSKIGFSNKYCDYLISSERGVVNDFRKTFSYFERAKSVKGLVEVSDGITWDAIFCMRDLLRELPQIYL